MSSPTRQTLLVRCCGQLARSWTFLI